MIFYYLTCRLQNNAYGTSTQVLSISRPLTLLQTNATHVQNDPFREINVHITVGLYKKLNVTNTPRDMCIRLPVLFTSRPTSIHSTLRAIIRLWRQSRVVRDVSLAHVVYKRKEGRQEIRRRKRRGIHMGPASGIFAGTSSGITLGADFEPVL